MFGTFLNVRARVHPWSITWLIDLPRRAVNKSNGVRSSVEPAGFDTVALYDGGCIWYSRIIWWALNKIQSHYLMEAVFDTVALFYGVGHDTVALFDGGCIWYSRIIWWRLYLIQLHYLIGAGFDTIALFDGAAEFWLRIKFGWFCSRKLTSRGLCESVC